MPECPQWRLRNSHYLNVPGTTWEKTEIHRESGKQARQTYNVPRLVDPNDPGDCNREGDCIVYHAVEGGRPPRHAIEFIGDPTPEMEPVNDEAQAISDTFAEKWATPFESFQTTETGEYGERLFKGIEAALSRAIAGAGGVPAISNSAVSIDEFNALKAQLAELQAMLNQKQPERRV